MTSKFAAGLVEGLKDGPSLFFAPLVGAVMGIKNAIEYEVKKKEPGDHPVRGPEIEVVEGHKARREPDDVKI